MRVRRKASAYKAFLSGLASILLLSSCTGEHASLTVQLCLASDRGVDLFKQTLQSVARDERMRYIDGSKATEKKLQVIGATGTNMHTDGRLIHVAVVSDSGPGLTAGNMGLNPYDVAVGFSRGRDVDTDHAFSDKVIARLEKHWTLKIVPKDSGAFPNPECTKGTEAPPNNSFKPKPLRGSA